MMIEDTMISQHYVNFFCLFIHVAIVKKDKTQFEEEKADLRKTTEELRAKKDLCITEFCREIFFHLIIHLFPNYVSVLNIVYKLNSFCV